LTTDRIYTNVEQYRGKVLYRGYEDGKRWEKRINYQPTLYIPTNGPAKFQALDGTQVSAVKQDSISKSREFIKRYRGMDNFYVYGDIAPKYAFLNEAFPGTVDFDPNQIKIGYLDIEVEIRDGYAEPEDPFEPITTITLKCGGRFYVFGLKDYTPKDNTEYYLATDEADMLEQFIATWRALDMDVVSGWNIQFFDIPYLMNRIDRVLDDDASMKLSPWGAINTRNAIIHGREQVAITLLGMSILDYMELYKKFTFTQQASYKLDHIAFVELDQKKIDYSEYGSLADLYEKNFQLYVDYNIQDVELIERLEEKMKFIEQAYALAYSAKVNFNDVFSQVRMWDVMIHNYLLDRNIVVPQKKPTRKDEKYTGAYVAEPQCGMHEWVVSFDLASLYPMLIQQYNISPETITNMTLDVNIQNIIDKKISYENEEVCVAANGHTFRKDIRGFLPEIMEKLYVERRNYKQEMLKSQSELESIKAEIRRRSKKD